MRVVVLPTLLLAVISTSCILPCAAADPLKSSLQSGESIADIFEPLNVTGPFAGDRHCLVCENGANPVVMIFAREPHATLAKLLAKVEAATSKHKQEMTSFAVFLSEAEDLPEKLKETAKKQALKKIVLATDAPAGPSGFKVAPAADVTVVIYERFEVKANHAFRKGELNDAAIERILADVTKLFFK